MKMKDIAMGMIGRMSTKPKCTFCTILEQVRFAIIIETFLQWRRGQLTSYFELLPSIVAEISLTKLIKFFHRQCEKDSTAYRLVSDKTKQQFKKQYDILKVMVACYLVICRELHMNKPYAVYYALSLNSILKLFLAFKTDIILWRITIGDRISVDDAHKICTAVNKERYPRRRKMDVLDIRYFLCDGLRRGFKMNTIKALLQIYPDYINILDRDESKTPFELACRFSSSDIVQYMVELDDTLLDHWDEQGNTPLHWACQRRTFGNLKVVIIYWGGLDVVNYLLEKQMSLVTVANKDGDLPIHLTSDNIKECCVPAKRREEIKRYEAERVAIVWRLLLAYPDCLNCVSGNASGSNGKYIDDKKKNR